MRCQQCNRTLSSGATARKKYCRAACRACAYRARLRGTVQAVPGAEGSAAGAQPQVRAQKRSASRTRANRRSEVESRSARTARPEVAWPRVAFDEQVLSQAPPEATGYRLVLPSRAEKGGPIVLPTADASGAIRFWRLRPFELPDDIRLRDGQVYRLLWIDAQGVAVPPSGTRQLPGLRFFLGPPDSEEQRAAAQRAAILRDISDPMVRQRTEAEQARLILAALENEERRKAERHQLEVQEREQQLAMNRSKEQRRSERATERTKARLDGQLDKLLRMKERQDKQKAMVLFGGSLAAPLLSLGLDALMRYLKGEVVDRQWLREQLPDAVALMSEFADRLDRAVKQGDAEQPAKQAPALSSDTPATDETGSSPPTTISEEKSPQTASLELVTALSSLVGYSAPPKKPAGQQAMPAGTPAPAPPPAPAPAPTPPPMPAAPAPPPPPPPPPAPTTPTPMQPSEFPAEPSVAHTVEKSDAVITPSASPPEGVPATHENSPDSSDQMLLGLLRLLDAHTLRAEDTAALKLSGPGIEPLCELLYDRDRESFMTNSIRCIVLKQLGMPPAVMPGTRLSGAQISEINKLRDLPIAPLTFALARAQFRSVLGSVADVMFQLPPPFRSLTGKDRQRLDSLLRDPLQRSYVQYLLHAESAEDAGSASPPEPDARPSPDTCSQIRRVVRDPRKAQYLRQQLG